MRQLLYISWIDSRCMMAEEKDPKTLYTLKQSGKWMARAAWMSIFLIPNFTSQLVFHFHASFPRSLPLASSSILFPLWVDVAASSENLPPKCLDRTNRACYCTPLLPHIEDDFFPCSTFLRAEFLTLSWEKTYVDHQLAVSSVHCA